jgi:PKHD-type hydroxylase
MNNQDINKMFETLSDNKPKPMSSWLLKTDSVERWAFHKNLFTPEECKQIIEIGKRYDLDQATIFKSKDQVTEDIRQSNVAFLTPTEDMAWVYRRLTDCITYLNDTYFKFDLFSFGENLQFTEYIAPTGKYDYHVDKIYNGPVRKLSIVIQLTDPTEYVGGDFEIFDSSEPNKLSREQGTILVFPSYTLHRVTPVTEGIRHSLVGWINGPNFK